MDRSDSSPDRAEIERRYMLELGQRIRLAREQRGMTQKSAAEAAGVATDMISRIENGRYTSPGLRTILRIAEGLGAPLSDLLPENTSITSLSAVEHGLKARLTSLTHRADPKELELIVELASTVIAKKRNQS